MPRAQHTPYTWCLDSLLQVSLQFTFTENAHSTKIGWRAFLPLGDAPKLAGESFYYQGVRLFSGNVPLNHFDKSEMDFW